LGSVESRRTFKLRKTRNFRGVHWKQNANPRQHGNLSNESDKIELIKINNINAYQNLPFVIFPKYKLKFLIDTGSTKSFINPKIAWKLLPKAIYNEKFIIRTPHSQSQHNFAANITLPKILNTNNLSHKFYLFNFNNNFDGLLGIDLIKTLNAKLNFEDNKFITNTAEIPIYFNEQNKIAHVEKPRDQISTQKNFATSEKSRSVYQENETMAQLNKLSMTDLKQLGRSNKDSKDEDCNNKDKAAQSYHMKRNMTCKNKDDFLDYKNFIVSKNNQVKNCSIVEVNQDLFKLSNVCLAHCVSKDLEMKKGIASEFRKRFNNIFALRKQNQDIGGVAIIKDKERYIYYLITKGKYYHKPKLQDVCSALVNLRQHLTRNNINKIAIPRIGSGLDRLDWEKQVKPLIEYVFRRDNIEIIVCNYKKHFKGNIRYASENSKTLKCHNIIKIEPRMERLIKIKVNSKNNRNEAILPYQRINNCEIPECLVEIKNGYAYTSIRNLSENEEYIDLNNSFEVEDIDLNQFNMNHIEGGPLENMSVTQKDILLRENLKNIRMEHMNKEEREQIKNLCFKFRDIFHCEEIPLTFTNQIKHEIRVNDENPVFIKPYRLPHFQKQEIDKQILSMKQQGIIRDSVSPWNSPVHLVSKKMDASGKQKWRMVIDFRKVNEKTVTDKYPIPAISDILDKLGRSQYFTTLDLASGYHQVEMHPNDIGKTAFSTERGHYEFCRMPFGLKNAPATFQRVMDNILRGIQNEMCAVYLDDIIIYSTSLQEHIQRLTEVFKRLRKTNLKVQLDKSEFLRREVNYLGHTITPEGVKPDKNKIKAILEFPIPKTQREIKSYLGLLGYYRKFIKDFAELTKPMTKCLKKNARIDLNEEYVESFEKSKDLLVNFPILQYPDFNKEFILTTDASNFALGAVLSQGIIGQDRPIAFASRTLNETETKYSTIEKELLAIVWAVKYFRPYLYGTKFTIVTDHKPLIWLFSLKDPSSKLTRWRLKLEEYNFELIHKKGKLNANADALSRIQLNAVFSDENNKTNNESGEMICDELIKNSEIYQTPGPSKSKRIKIIEDMLIKPSDELEEENIEESSSINENESTKDSNIEEKEDIINNKSKQIYFKSVYNNAAKPKIINVGHMKKYYIEILKEENENQIKKILKEYCEPKRVYYCYFDTEEMYNDVNEVYKNLFNERNKPIMIKCKTKLIDIEEKDEQLQTIINNHEGKTNHRGITETYERISKRYYWPNMKTDIERYIKNCQLCLKNKYERHPVKVPLVLTETPSKPMEKLHVDIFTIENHKFLTVIDAFTKLGQAMLIRTRNATEIAEKLINYFQFYGVPDTITFDNGTEFQNTLVQNLCSIHKIKIHFTTPKHPQSNGLIERFHSTILEHYRLLKAQFNEKPSQLMTYAVIAYNNSIHTSTGFTPVELLLGHSNIRNPYDLFYNQEFYTEYVDKHKEKLKKTYDLVKDKMQNDKEKVIERTNINREKECIFKIGQEVFEKTDRRSKHLPRYLGPFKIKSIDNENHTCIVMDKNKKERKMHFDNLRHPLSDSSQC